jgi:glycosyltransferase involved in cell wall biosynthesis
MAEVVRLANAGYTVSVTDSQAMGEAIVRLAKSDAEREQFSRSGESAFHRYFSFQTMVDAYMGLYRNTPRARRRGIR